MASSSLPLFHLDGDPPQDQAFDFIHVEIIAARAAGQDWMIHAQRHRSLFQILLIERGGGAMIHEAAQIAIEAPAAILVAPRVAHGFRFRPEITEGWAVSFTEDVADSFGARAGAALASMRALAAAPVVPLGGAEEAQRLSALCADLHEEQFFARPGSPLAMRARLALIAVAVARLAAGHARAGGAAVSPAEPTLDAVRRLVEEHFRKERQIAFYAGLLKTNAGRLNEQVKRAVGVTVGHLIRQRLLTEAKRQLVFTNQPIHVIATDLAFADPSHFARFFRKHTRINPQAFRDGKSGVPNGTALTLS